MSSHGTEDEDELEHAHRAPLGAPLSRADLEALGLRGQPRQRPALSRTVQDRRNGITRPAIFGREWSPTRDDINRWGASLAIEWDANGSKSFGDLCLAEWSYPISWQGIVHVAGGLILPQPIELVAQLGVGSTVLEFVQPFGGGAFPSFVAGGGILPAETIRLSLRVNAAVVPSGQTFLITGILAPVSPR